VVRDANCFAGLTLKQSERKAMGLSMPPVRLRGWINMATTVVNIASSHPENDASVMLNHFSFHLEETAAGAVWPASRVAQFPGWAVDSEIPIGCYFNGGLRPIGIGD
jgi:hypothetical protein